MDMVMSTKRKLQGTENKFTSCLPGKINYCKLRPIQRNAENIKETIVSRHRPTWTILLQHDNDRVLTSHATRVPLKRLKFEFNTHCIRSFTRVFTYVLFFFHGISNTLTGPECLKAVLRTRLLMYPETTIFSRPSKAPFSRRIRVKEAAKSLIEERLIVYFINGVKKLATR